MHMTPRRVLLRVALGALLAALASPAAQAGTLYVTNRGSGTLAILDEASLTVRTVIRVGEKAWGHDELTVADLESGTIRRVATGGTRPFAILRTP